MPKERKLFVLYRISYFVVAFALFASVSPCQQAVTGSSSAEREQRSAAQAHSWHHSQLQDFSKPAKLRTIDHRREVQVSLRRCIRSWDRRPGGFVRRRGPVDQCKSIIRARRCGIRQVFRRIVWRPRSRRLHDGGGFPHASPPRSPLLSTRYGKWMVQVRLRNGTDLLDPSRFGRHAVQLFGSNRKLNRGGNFERLLRGQPDS